MAVPPLFAERMRTLLGAEAEELLAALARPPLAGLRINTLKLSPEAFQALVPWPLTPVPWCPSGFLVASEERPGKHPFHAAGLYYLQEPSAMAVAEALAQPAGIDSGELVLDLAAAPGGKATHLASLMGGRGLLVANEIERGRTKALTENLERWGVRRALIINEDPARIAARWGPIFDRVLLDAPCSGEGMFRKSAAAVADWSPEIVRGCAMRQRQAIEAAAALVRPGGLLAYSTCTFAPEEDEQVIARFLDRHRDFALVPLSLPSALPGRPEWVDPALARADLALTARLWPHRIPGEGHFVALLRRTDGPAPQLVLARFKEAPKAARELWRDFVRSALSGDPAADDALVVYGEQLYAVPRDAPAFDGLHMVRAGLWLGTLRRDRLEPSHSLALTIDAAAAMRRLDLSADDERTLRYLQGHPLDEPGEPGWVLVCVDGFPLGWGRRAGAVVKNAYPKGLRWR